MDKYQKHSDLAFAMKIVGLVLLLVLVFFLSITIGTRKISLEALVESFLHYDSQNSEHVIMQTLRVPRAVIAIAVGASLAVSGSLMQAVTRNPMASPSILGISAGAGFGLAVAMIVFANVTLNQTIFFSFGGAAIAMAVISAISSVCRAGRSPLRLALVGTAITALFNAFSQALAMYFKISQDLTYWNAGGISGVRPEQMRLLLPWAVVGLIFSLMLARSVSLLALGEDVAIGLGGRLKYIKLASSVTVLILTGSAVAIAGPIGFVGLVVPHTAKLLVGSDYRKTIPCSIIAGGLLLTLADILSRVVNPPFETPTGAITALVGVPFFVYLASRKGGV